MPDDTPTHEEILTTRFHDFLEREALHLNAPPEAILTALATNTAAIMFRHYRVTDRPTVRVQFAQLLSGALKRMDGIKAAGQ
ncbi:MAG: hypothetical protein R3F13_13195 [Prosthecobacter sp.]